MSKSIKEVAQIASEWWADKVISPKFDNGDTGSGGFFAMAFATMATKPVDNESRNKFVSFLIGSIEEHLNKGSGIILDVDYGPCKTLRDASIYSGISCNNFPWKTVMWIDKDHVSVRYGYGGEVTNLYSNKAHWQYHIDSARQAIEEYQSGNMLSWINDEEERKVEANQRISEILKDIDKYQNYLKNADE